MMTSCWLADQSHASKLMLSSDGQGEDRTAFYTAAEEEEMSPKLATHAAAPKKPPAKEVSNVALSEQVNAHTAVLLQIIYLRWGRRQRSEG